MPRTPRQPTPPLNRGSPTAAPPSKTLLTLSTTLLTLFQKGLASQGSSLGAELDEIKEVIVLYPKKRGAKTAPQHTVLSKTSELQQALLAILHVKPEEIVLLG